MSNDFFQVNVNSKQELCVAGRIDMSNVVQISTSCKNLIDTLNNVRINLSGVEYADSSSLALLVDCIRSAKMQHKDILFCNMPQFMLDLGRVCGLDAILPINKPLQFHN